MSDIENTDIIMYSLIIGIVFTIIYFITLLKNQANRKKYLIEHNSIASRFCSQTHFCEECYTSKNYENNCECKEK